MAEEKNPYQDSFIPGEESEEELPEEEAHVFTWEEFFLGFALAVIGVLMALVLVEFFLG